MNVARGPRQIYTIARSKRFVKGEVNPSFLILLLDFNSVDQQLFRSIERL